MSVSLRCGLDFVADRRFGRSVTSKPRRLGTTVTAVPKFTLLRVGAITVAGSVLASALSPAPPAHAVPGSVAGMIVFLDPGHNGANDASLTRQVSNGRGGTKDCQTTGTATEDGYPEHTFNWDTTLRIRAALHALGVRTAMSRGNDDQVGPCIDERAAMANALQPNAVVSIHGDGGPATGRGFHILYASPALNAAQAGPSVQFARMMRDQIAAAGIPPSTYIGSNGLNPRADIAGLNLAQYPSILVELGNMKNPVDSTLMSSVEGRQKYAQAVANGVVAFLQTQPPRTS
ncbi:MAG: Rv3717 family N-acetylmuramoyl-L-alanine amidase [Mycobacterium sp.]|nr:Rv3717 family N-acetylmuramoyl-L-alanine amidase [Mycobacterium sp.]